jgi:hypothetical protein
MAFPKPIPASGTAHFEGTKKFVARSTDWVEGQRHASKWFTSVGDADPSYQWIGIEEATKTISVVGSFINSSSHYNLGFIAHDGSNIIEFSDTMVPNSFIVETWGGNGDFIRVWSGEKAFSGGEGIPLNQNKPTFHVKQNNYCFAEVRLAKLANGTMMRWMLQHQGETNDEIVTVGLAYIKQPIGAFRKVGFKATQTIDSMFIGINYA